MSTPESLLKIDSLEAVKQILLDNLPSWVKKEWLVVENIRPSGAPLSKETLADMTFSSFYAPPAISAKFKDPLTFQFQRLNLSEFLAGVDKKVKFKGVVSSVDILSRLLVKYGIPVTESDVELFTTEVAGSYVITAPSTSPRWVGSIALQLIREAYLLKEFFKNSNIYIPFAPSFRSDDFLTVLLKAIQNTNSSFDEPYTLRAEDFRITSGPNVVTADDTGLNTTITLTGVGGDFTGSMDFTYQRKSYTDTYRHAVTVATGGVVTRAKVLDAINFKFDTGLVEQDISNWESLPARLDNEAVYRLTTVSNSLTTVGDIYVELVMWDGSNQTDLATEIFSDVLDGITLTHTCKIPIGVVANNKLLDGLEPPFAAPDITICTSEPYLDGFTSNKGVLIGERTDEPYLKGFETAKPILIGECTENAYLDGWDSEKRLPISEAVLITSIDGFDSDKRKLLGDYISRLDGFRSDKKRLLDEEVRALKLDGFDVKGKDLNVIVTEPALDGFVSDKIKALPNTVVDTELLGFDTDKLKLLPQYVDDTSLAGFASDKKYRLDEAILDTDLDGYLSDKLKLLSQIVVERRLNGYESDKQRLLSETVLVHALDGYDSVKLKLLPEVVPDHTLEGYDSYKLHLLSEVIPVVELVGFIEDKRKRLSETVIVLDLVGFDNYKRRPLSEYVTVHQLDGFDGDTGKYLSEAVDVHSLNGFNSGKSKLLTEVVKKRKMNGFQTRKVKIRLSEVVLTILDGFEGKDPGGLHLKYVIQRKTPDGLYYPPKPVKPINK